MWGGHETYPRAQAVVSGDPRLQGTQEFWWHSPPELVDTIFRKKKSLLPRSPCSNICSFTWKTESRTFGSSCPQNSSWTWSLPSYWAVSLKSFFQCPPKNSSPPQCKQKTFHFVWELFREWGSPVWEKSKWTLSGRVCRAPRTGSGPLPGFQMGAKLAPGAWAWSRQKEGQRRMPLSDHLPRIYISSPTFSNHLVQNLTFKMCWIYATFKNSCNFHCGKYMLVPQNIKRKITLGSSNSTCAYTPRRTERGTWTGIFTCMCIAALFKIPKRQK